jgi:hypothetical protein
MRISPRATRLRPRPKPRRCSGPRARSCGRLVLSVLTILLLLAAGARRLAAAAAAATTAADTSCRILRYSFEPDCLVRDPAGACHFDETHPDFGPQVAVWIEAADSSRFVDTLMVTNAVALYGIGNRPGRWDFRSGPRFPYGRRPMALPVWAHRRGIVYSSVIMSDGQDDDIASHQEVSSPEPYFCRPMMASEVVDAITCASGNFRSSKGSFDTTMTLGPSYYPPRGDLVDWGNLCVPIISVDGAGCDYGDARQFGLLNDVDTVATATPHYDQTYSGSWTIPASLAPGDYALMIEVGKEFDSNPSFTHASFMTTVELQFYSEYGFDGNVGQPSVVYRLDFTVPADPAAPPTSAATSVPVGYGDWTGASGDLTPMDARIGASPGSGSGRLRVTDGAGGPGRVHLDGAACPPVDCTTASPPDPPRVDEPTADQDPAAAAFQFRQGSDLGNPVLAYELRYTADNQRQLDETTFARWTPAPAPAPAAPGTVTSVTLPVLEPTTGYAVGLRTQGACGWSQPAFIRVYAGRAKYTQLSGCVVATAAYGSALHPDVALLRHERDLAVGQSSLARLVALLYAESAPPLATLVGQSEVVRTVVRAVLAPAVLVNRGALLLGQRGE